MTQAQKILTHLESGRSITPALAYELFGCLALHSRISELRGDGYKITTRMVTHNGQRWGDYSLERK